MKSNLSLFFLLFILLLTTACQDDDAPVAPVNQLSRFDGWQLVSVESDFAERVTAAVTALPDSTVEKSGLTREEIRGNYDVRIAAVTGVEDCERDDVLFFDAGWVVLIKNGADCPENSPPHVLAGFDLKRYSTDFSVTRLTLTDDARSESSEYEVVELDDERLVVRQSRRVENNLILPSFSYTITYTFRGR
ncbi:hypothetical protein GGR26_001098 [Lewinella marina]|uniref:DUF5004 domain-containing protein n=1 Tax=Neolewinella marina TaxID=438751 RepID=A0A2G0CHT1_9BACT|nr:hypothetical protein [Neolewinella marina]NJB85353.1 hypothetical protein [Neolewinella marina]PHK99531.1 hypothetical protein CGL56_00290 [Neolewinella marina]